MTPPVLIPAVQWSLPPLWSRSSAVQQPSLPQLLVAVLSQHGRLCETASPLTPPLSTQMRSRLFHPKSVPPP